MDELCAKMRSVDQGLPVKTQKYFRTSVPAAFTAEAIHLANQFIHFGYLVPVFEPIAPLKEDNTLYRLQIPYFWPSQNMNPDNLEYAIFLSKRLLRSEEKHGLVDYEAESYQKLKQLLGHMWDFIETQAEMQFKIFKEKKKVEKVVLDNQEKAFWRIHRPPVFPSFLCEFSFGLYFLFTAFCIITILLPLFFSFPYLVVFIRLLFRLVLWSDQFSEYDPLMSSFPRDVGNPWIVDDTTLWQLNADNAEIPSEQRVRRWGFSIQELIRDPIGRQVLETFLESEFSQENIKFWIAVQDLKHSPSSQVEQKVETIYNEFLVSGAPCQINIDSQTLEAVTKAMKSNTMPSRYCFSQAEEHIFILMSKDSYPRFTRSEIYRGILTAAQQQGSKRLGWK
ncbi:unnamed protein product [Soboliphyme baturini]|uniref:RGS domain-containing protein n=1 Tax=Soboliphyme baturini TaxID=241478 RepID=A0A183ITQ8_9BILA|nr:unnamed protein product [Soboliphyme baturini]